MVERERERIKGKKLREGLGIKENRKRNEKKLKSGGGKTGSKGKKIMGN